MHDPYAPPLLVHFQYRKPPLIQHLYPHFANDRYFSKTTTSFFKHKNSYTSRFYSLKWLKIEQVILFLPNKNIRGAFHRIKFSDSSPIMK